MSFSRTELPLICSKDSRFDNFAIDVNQFFHDVAQDTKEMNLLVFNANRCISLQANSLEELKIIYKENPLILNKNDVDEEMLQEVRNFHKIFNTEECFVNFFSESLFSKQIVFFMNCAYRDYIEQNEKSRLYYFFLFKNNEGKVRVLVSACKHSCDFINTFVI